MTVVFIIAMTLIGVAALAMTFRIVRGPGILDRMIAAEGFLVSVVMAMMTEMVYNRHTTTLPIALVITALGFVGPVSVARYVGTYSPREQS